MPAPKREPPTGPAVTPEGAISAVYSAYRSGPIADRVRVTVKGPNGAENRSGLVVRTRPADGSSPPEALVEAGSLVIHARGNIITAVHRSFPHTYWQTTIDAEAANSSGLAAFTAALGPLPLPQLAVIFGRRAERLSAPVPQASGVEWTEVRRVWGPEPVAGDGRSAPASAPPDGTGNGSAPPALPEPARHLVVEGSWSAGASTLTIDEATGRLVELRTPLGPLGTHLELAVAPEPDPAPAPETQPPATPGETPVPPSKPGDRHGGIPVFRLAGPWSLPLEGRTRVELISKLGSRPEATTPAGAAGGPDPSGVSKSY